MTKLIEVIISPAGETHLETRGFTGTACRQASLFLEQALGTKLEERLTPEFYAEATHHNHAATKSGAN
ncbi:DUF2997 domain-containing protein [Anatilimnocola sp. NA78]|uniref:DUF2997 domain-containing protein n=1 Tax=Anatilimnocola sp. NA78 TaxID=3415683 RepID=UPI003CE460C5